VLTLGVGDWFSSSHPLWATRRCRCSLPCHRGKRLVSQCPRPRAEDPRSRRPRHGDRRSCWPIPWVLGARHDGPSPALPRLQPRASAAYPVVPAPTCPSKYQQAGSRHQSLPVGEIASLSILQRPLASDPAGHKAQPKAVGFSEVAAKDDCLAIAFRGNKMSALGQKQTCAVQLGMSAKCHVWTAPSWQELSSRLQPWSVQPCVRPLNAAHRAAGHNALRGSGMSRPTVVTTCMIGSSESWLHQQQPYSWHSRAGGGAVHSINSGLRRSAAERCAAQNPFPCQFNVAYVKF